MVTWSRYSQILFLMIPFFKGLTKIAQFILTILLALFQEFHSQLNLNSK